MDVTGQYIEVRFFFDKDAFVSALVEVPHASAAAVEVASVSDIKMAHEFAEVAERCLHQQVEMIVHENICVEFDAIDVQGLEEDAKELCSVLIIQEDVSTFVPSAGYVIDRSGILDTQWSGHDLLYDKFFFLSIMKI